MGIIPTGICDVEHKIEHLDKNFKVLETGNSGPVVGKVPIFAVLTFICTK